jgi:uncharacterized membrane protein YbaN (DUF454 family)
MRVFARPVFLFLGFLFTGLGFLGATLPLLPTVPFLIVALFCFSKSSKKFHDWLYNHRLFGGQLRLWDKYRVIPPIAKFASIGSMSASFIYMAFFTEIPVIALICSALVMAYAAYYILTKPSYPPK